MPLVDLMDRLRALRDRRTVPLDGRPFSIEDDAAVCAQLLGHVGFDRPHVVGHSYGGVLALALAGSRAVALRTIALLEPAGSGFPRPRAGHSWAGAVDGAVPHARALAVVAEQFLGVVLGEDARGLLDRFLPGSFDEIVAHTDQFFQVELPAIARWSFGRDDARLIDQPILNVVGTKTVPRFVQTDGFLSFYPRTPSASSCREPAT